MNRISLLLLVLVSLMWTLVAPVQAHTTSVTPVSVKVRGETVSVQLQLHQADLIQHVIDTSHSRSRFADRAEFDDVAPRLLDYVLARLTLKADGAAVPLTAVDWPPSHVVLTRMDSKGVEEASPIAVELRAVLPARASKLELQPTLFSAPNFAAIFNCTIDVEGRGPTTYVCDKYQPIVIDVTPSLASSDPQSVAPQAAAASSFWDALVRFFVMGFHHIVPVGLDHILFVLGLYFLSPKIKDLLWQVTAFTVAHSITLALAAFDVFTLPASFVEPMIALSIVAVAVENLFSKDKPVRPWRWALVFAFGLIHGMGFADILHETQLPAGQTLTAILSFNLGVEAGQIAVLLGAMLLTAWWQKRPWYFRFVAAPASVMIACVGAFWAMERIFG